MLSVPLILCLSFILLFFHAAVSLSFLVLFSCLYPLALKSLVAVAEVSPALFVFKLRTSLLSTFQKEKCLEHQFWLKLKHFSAQPKQFSRATPRLGKLEFCNVSAKWFYKTVFCCSLWWNKVGNAALSDKMSRKAKLTYSVDKTWQERATFQVLLNTHLDPFLQAVNLHDGRQHFHPCCRKCLVYFNKSKNMQNNAFNFIRSFIPSNNTNFIQPWLRYSASYLFLLHFSFHFSYFDIVFI